jgi:hypothetical protein
VPCDTPLEVCPSVGGQAYGVRVRAHGVLNEIPGAGASDHLCWVYDDDEVFDRAVRQFLAGGLERGERLLCVGDRVIDSLRSEADVLGGVDALIARGALQTLSLADAYEASVEFMPEEQWAFYDAATRQAIDDGYRGLRVVAEVSALAADPATRSDLMRWEQLADEYIARGTGFTAMCAYRSDLAAAALADVASVHPLVHAPEGASSFRVFAQDDHIALTGSVDTFSAERFGRVLASSPVGHRDAVLDLSLADFLDVAGSRTIARWARGLAAQSVPVELRGASPLFVRMWRLLSLDDIAPVTFAVSPA